MEYLVQWEGYSEPTWEPAENLAGTTLIEDFWAARGGVQQQPPPLER